LFSYEQLFHDIALDLSQNKETAYVDKLLNCFDYLEYAYTQADLAEDGFTIEEVYTELGRLYLYECKNYDHAVLCFNRALEIRRISHSDESFTFGPLYECLADAYALLDFEKALENYEKAIDQYSRQKNLFNIDLALCWCKLGYLRREHQVEPFNCALTIILSIEDQQCCLNGDEVPSCLLYLAKSCARCESLLDMALEICQATFRLYPNDFNPQTGIGNDFHECIELLMALYEKKSSKLNIVYNFSE
jgi:tetratricopeptide (TPR) repeat protein